MQDDFQNSIPGLDAPIEAAVAVSPDDGADLPMVSRALYLGTAGDLRVTLRRGSTVTFPAMGAGWHPIRVRRVHASGTTAGGILAGW